MEWFKETEDFTQEQAYFANYVGELIRCEHNEGLGRAVIGNFIANLAVLYRSEEDINLLAKEAIELFGYIVDKNNEDNY